MSIFRGICWNSTKFSQQERCSYKIHLISQFLRHLQQFDCPYHLFFDYFCYYLNYFSQTKLFVVKIPCKLQCYHNEQCSEIFMYFSDILFTINTRRISCSFIFFSGMDFVFRNSAGIIQGPLISVTCYRAFSMLNIGGTYQKVLWPDLREKCQKTVKTITATTTKNTISNFSNYCKKIKTHSM